MACRDWPDNYDPTGEIQRSHDHVRDLQDKIHKLTRFLCTALRYVDDPDLKLPSELLEWWADHKELDDARLAADKLTEEEKAALTRYFLKKGRMPE